MKLRICYFAILREQRGLSHEDLETTANDPQELYAELKQRYQFSLDQQNLAVAINDAFCSWDQKLCVNDKVVFIPPVAGG